MRLAFCDYHISVILEKFGAEPKPLDLLLSDYFRTHKSIGAHDRRQIGETLYQMVRWKSLIDFFCPSPKPIERLFCFRKMSIDQCRQDPSIPEEIRAGASRYLFEKLCNAFGKDKGKELLRILNTQAPTVIRANRLKTTRGALLEILQKKFQVRPCLKAEAGIAFEKREPLFSLPEFKEGLFEMQDEGSQLVAEAVEAKPGDHVLDYCSGSGGKTLSFAHRMEGKGQIYLHDIRQQVLLEARKRLKRAGVQNAQFVLPKKKVDWLLLDVPCSGSGSLRRNPDAKWKIDATMVQRLVLEQRQIMKDSLPFLKTGGHLVYITCSLFPEENGDQVAHFLKNHPLVLEKELFLLPEEGGMDGFFAAVFKKIENLVG